jgi:ABC-type bacteriocin/lantibiotic exporter with double-glycine peptidase domain
MGTLIAFFWQRKLHTLFLMLLVISISFFSMMVPLVLSVLTDVILPQGYIWHFALLMGILVLLVVVRMAINFLQDYFFMKSRFLFEKHMLWLVVDGSLRRKVCELEFEDGADVIARLSTFITNFQFNFSEIFYFILYSMFVSSVVILLIAFTSTEFFLLALLFLFFHYVNLMLHMDKAKQLSISYVDEKNKFSARINNFLDSKKVINLFGLNAYVEQLVGDEVSSLYQKHHARERLVNRQELIQSLLKNLLFILMVLLGIVAVREQELSMAMVLLCVLLIGFVYDPVYRLNVITKAYADCRAQLSALLNKAGVDNHQAMGVDYFAEPSALVDINEIELRDLTLQRDDQMLFERLQVRLRPGKLYLLDGVSGSGKSSLLRIIAGLDRASDGEVLWNGMPLAQFLAQGRPSLSLCPQKIYWAETSTVDNISLFAPNPDLQRVAGVLRDSGCEFVDLSRLSTEPSVSNTWSGGQLRRLGVARALYAKATVFLFDEPTANLDAATEQAIIERLHILAARHIVVICSHSPALKASADFRIELNRDAGRTQLYSKNHSGNVSLERVHGGRGDQDDC